MERGHQVTVLTGIPNYPEGRFFKGYGFLKNQRQDYHGVKIIRVPLLSRGKGSGFHLAINYLSFALFSSMLAPFLCRGKYDLIFVCQLSPVTVGLPALVLKKLKKIPIVFWILDLWPESLSATGEVHSQRILGMVDRLVSFIYHGCDKILVSSLGFVPSIQAKGISEAKTGYFPNWYEPEYDKPEEVRTELPDGFRIMFAGNIGSAQGFETILDAAEKLKTYKDIHWVILGDGRRFDWVKEQVALRDLTSTMHLLGRHRSEEMTGFFAGADVMLVTLKRDPLFTLTVPGKIQSYMACGRPIIAALDGEGGRLVAESCAGLAVHSEDVNALADAVLCMYQMPKEQREEMGRRGRVYCEANFERNKLIDRLENWMLELVKARG